MMFEIEMREIELPKAMDYSVSAVEVAISLIRKEVHAEIEFLFFVLHIPSTSIDAFNQLRSIFDKAHMDILVVRENLCSDRQWRIVAYFKDNNMPCACIKVFPSC